MGQVLLVRQLVVHSSSFAQLQTLYPEIKLYSNSSDSKLCSNSESFSITLAKIIATKEVSFVRPEQSQSVYFDV